MTDAESELTAMIHRYCELFDSGRFDEFAAQFAHGQWHRAEPGSAAVLRWIEEWVHVYDGVPATKHVTSNLIVEVDDKGDAAAASSYMTVFQALPDFPLQPILAGRYRDRFVRRDGQWQWDVREVFGDLRGDTSRHKRAVPRSLST